MFIDSYILGIQCPFLPALSLMRSLFVLQLMPIKKFLTTNWTLLILHYDRSFSTEAVPCLSPIHSAFWNPPGCSSTSSCSNSQTPWMPLGVRLLLQLTWITNLASFLPPCFLAMPISSSYISQDPCRKHKPVLPWKEAFSWNLGWEEDLSQWEFMKPSLPWATPSTLETRKCFLLVYWKLTSLLLMMSRRISLK